ncbi:MAG TPA: hypothetical protein VEL79_20295 [Vicinamibacterales bacterium]|nr:hypothetical protein [Vicinamibacterales bacterium]
MANRRGNDNQSEQDRQAEYIRGGKGRKDEVGRSGIYPTSAPDAPANAPVRTEGDLVGHKGARRKKES